MKLDFNLDIFDISEITSQFLKDAIRRSIVADHCRKIKCLFGVPFLFFGQVFFIPFYLIYRAFDHIHDHLVKLCGVFRCNDRLSSVLLNGPSGLTCDPAAAPGYLLIL